jgi:transcriptional regulator with XRE-family HTH domain
METQATTLKDLRKRRGLTLVQLAQASGVAHGNLSRIERGREGVTVKRVVQIADALAMPASEVFAAILEASQRAANDQPAGQAA